MTRGYRIEAPHFVAGIDVEGTEVVRAAPILKYMIGWTMGRVQQYCVAKRWFIEVLFEQP